MKRWTRRPEGSTWGDWGEDDQLGRLNLLTPEKVRQGVAEVKEGLSFCLSLPLDFPGGAILNPRRHPPVLSPTGDEGGWRFNFATSRVDQRWTDVVSDDRVMLTLQYSSQWDSLAHVGGKFDVDGDGEDEPVYYNGFRAGEDVIGPMEDAGGDGCGNLCYAHKLGIDNLAKKPVQGRGVLVNLRKHFGDLPRRWVSYDDLMHVMDKEKVVVEPGDMLVLHTGFATKLVEWNRKPDPKLVHEICAVLDGRDRKLLQWISDSKIAALIADNYGVEGVPSKDAGSGPQPSLPLHQHCIFKLGLNLGEIWWTQELADWLDRNGRSRFLLTAPPLRLPGAVGSPANPVATV